MADDTAVMEEREELMVSRRGGHVCRRRAHFLVPSVSSIDGPVAAPSPDSSSSSATRLSGFKDLPFKVNYRGWRNPSKIWRTWVDQMHSLHHPTWKGAGILDAIMSSTCVIHRYDDLIFGFVDKWCPTTNSFVFPWGEATVTLEDVMVLGGYAVLGESVLIAPGDGEMEEIVKKLLNARSDISRSKAKKATQGKWITQFMGRGTEFEHEAFLAYWLSKFVFPFSRDAIGRSVLSVAVHLARGTKIALAPAVLACIYKSLTLLKAAIIAARKSGTKEEGQSVRVVEVTVPAPLALVQVWIWERFPSLGPGPNSTGRNEPRLARWHNLKVSSGYGSLKIDSTGRDFQWRPYTTTESSVFPGMIYMDQEFWAVVDSDLDDDLQGFVRCLRTSELFSLEADWTEHYLPHRVAMQFGMDQDLPGHVARVDVTSEIAWSHYTRPIRDTKIYVPACVTEPCVTARYLKWWRKLSLGWGGIDGKRSTKLQVKKDLFGRKSADDFFSQTHGFSLKRKRIQKAGASGTAGQFQDQLVQRQSPSFSTANNGGSGIGGKGSSNSSKRPRKSVKSSSRRRLDYDESDPPPGFAPKHSLVEASHSGTGLEKRVNQLSSSGIYGNNESQDDDQGKHYSSSTANNENIQEVTSLAEPVESEVECVMTKETRTDALDKKTGASPSQVQSSSTSRPPGIGVEERLRNLEKLIAFIKQDN